MDACRLHSEDPAQFERTASPSRSQDYVNQDYVNVATKA